VVEAVTYLRTSSAERTSTRPLRARKATFCEASLLKMAQERERCRKLTVSIRLEHLAMAHDYAVEVPAQNRLDRLSRCLPISNCSEPNEPMRAEVPDIP